jgi:outer membrane protein OmpA-like peptidoglycan-associated protein
MKRLNLFYGAAALIAVSLAASPTLSAQEDGNRDEYGKVVRGPYETNRFGDNWFIGVGGGINAIWNEGMDADNMKIAPSIDANFGKWFTPAVGMRAGYQGIAMQVKDQDKLGYMYFHGDFLWNISDALGGYKETRFWDFVPYLHAGYFRSYGLGSNDFADNEIAAGAGLLHNLRLTDRLDLAIDMRATVVNGRVLASDGVAVLPSVTMGLAVDLGWPNFIRSSTIIGGIEAVAAENMAVLETAALALEMANAALEDQNAQLAASNKKLKKENSALKKQVVSTDQLFKDMGPATVYFNIGKTVLSDKELQHLDFIATNLLTKVDKDTKIYITLLGTADGTTGSIKRNQYLSQARGAYVYTLLTEKYGISSDRLVVQSEVVESPADPALTRSVVIKF